MLSKHCGSRLASDVLISWLHDAPILRRCIIESIHRRTGRETLSEAQKNTERERERKRGKEMFI